MKVWFDDIWHISTNNCIDAFKSEIGNDLCPYKTFGEMFLNNFKYIDNPSDVLNKNYTYMFEMVSPYTKVVVNYPDINIYHIGTRNNITGEELNVDIGINKPNIYNLQTEQEVKEAANRLPFNEEGYVVVDSFYNRVKIKSPSYVNAHRLINNHVVSKEKILDLVRANEQSEFLSYFPEYKNSFQDIENRYNNFVLWSRHYADIIMEVSNNTVSNKHFALWIKNILPEYADMGFQLRNKTISGYKEYIDNLTSRKIIERLYKNETKKI